MIDRFYIVPKIGGIAYLNISKAACTSILVALAKMRNANDFCFKNTLLKDGSNAIHGFHPPYLHMENFFRRWPVANPPLPEKFIKFSFVRNPYHRLFSFYKSKIVNRQAPYKYYEALGIKHGCSFSECVDKITSLDPHKLEHHAAPQSLLIFYDNEILVDYIGKVESLEDDWKAIIKLTGFEINLTRENVTERKKIQINEETRERIYQYYKNDFELFGYDRDSISCIENSVKPSKRPKIYTAHLYQPVDLQQIKEKINKSSLKIRNTARLFANNSKLRKEYFESQQECFNEIILKNQYAIEKTIKEKDVSIDFLKSENTYLMSAVTKLDEHVNNSLKTTILFIFLLSKKSVFKRIKRIVMYRFKSEVQILKKSKLVDPAFYFQKYPEVVNNGLCANDHYVKIGVFEGKNPNKNFDTVTYLSENPVALTNGINPLVHKFLKMK